MHYEYGLFFSLVAVAASVSVAQHVNPPLPAEKAQILCIYRLSYQPDSLDVARRTELMRLTLGKSISEFESEGTYLADSINHYTADMPDNQENIQSLVDKLSVLPHSRFSFKIFKNRSINSIYSYDGIGTKLYQYADSFLVNKWQIGSEKATIAGYACQKATVVFAGRIFEAWFTREISVPDGPYKFYGLPGLIIKVNDTRKQYVFELTKLKQLKQILSITLPTQATSTTRAVLQQGKRNHYANLSTTALALTAGASQPSPELKQTERVRINKKFNNSLELR